MAPDAAPGPGAAAEQQRRVAERQASLSGPLSPHVEHRMVEPVLGAEPRHALRIELEPVAGADLAQLRRVELAAAPMSVPNSSKKSSNPPGEMISRIRQGVSGVPEGVHWSRGLNTNSPASA